MHAIRIKLYLYRVGNSTPQILNIKVCHLKQTYFYTPHCWGRLVFLQPFPKIHTSHQYLEDLECFEAIFKIFACAVFEAIEVKGQSRLNFKAATSKFCNHFWKFGCQPRKSKADLGMTNGSTVLIYLCFFYCSSKTYFCK